MQRLTKEAVANYIKTKRQELNISQDDLARELHVTTSAVSKWERGLNYQDIEILDQL